ncbi:DUF1648 domain-containing protein [Bifidobacterium adolescentis]|uniref:DUF1648 domain-containing protein n=1 Tax=Bifidobacterium adolescentis TaxID=1680 RepID=UPI003B9A1E8D
MQKQEKPETTKASTGIPARVWVVLMLLCVLNVVAHLAAMPGLPERIPMHWGADGGVNGWGPRWMASVLGALPLTFLALFLWCRALIRKVPHMPSSADSTKDS